MGKNFVLIRIRFFRYFSLYYLFYTCFLLREQHIYFDVFTWLSEVSKEGGGKHFRYSLSGTLGNDICSIIEGINPVISKRVGTVSACQIARAVIEARRGRIYRRKKTLLIIVFWWHLRKSSRCHPLPKWRFQLQIPHWRFLLLLWHHPNKQICLLENCQGIGKTLDSGNVFLKLRYNCWRNSGKESILEICTYRGSV